MGKIFTILLLLLSLSFAESLSFTDKMALRIKPKADFQGEDLSGVDFTAIAFRRDMDINLKKANFQGATLYFTTLQAANLKGANFNGIKDAEKLDLRVAQIQGMKARKAQLSKALLLYLDFSGVDLFEANLDGSDIRDSSFAGALNLETSSLKGVICNQNTLDRAGKYKELLKDSCIMREFEAYQI